MLPWSRRACQVFVTPTQRLHAADIEVGRRIRARRLAAGLSQAELGEPYTRAFVSAVEHGRCTPSLKVLWLFAFRLGTEVGELVDGVNPFGTAE